MLVFWKVGRILNTLIYRNWRVLLQWNSLVEAFMMNPWLIKEFTVRSVSSWYDIRCCLWSNFWDEIRHNKACSQGQIWVDRMHFSTWLGQNQRTYDKNWSSWSNFWRVFDQSSFDFAPIKLKIASGPLVSVPGINFKLCHFLIWATWKFLICGLDMCIFICQVTEGTFTISSQKLL